MMKPLGLRYKKIDMFLNYFMLYNSEYVNFTKCNTYQHAQYKPNNGR